MALLTATSDVAVVVVLNPLPAFANVSGARFVVNAVLIYALAPADGTAPTLELVPIAHDAHKTPPQ